VLVIALAIFVFVLGHAPGRADETPLSISGNHFVNGSGETLQLVGVDRTSPEYACFYGYAYSNGPIDASDAGTIAAWHANAVRIPLNEDCWLGINGVKPRYSGANYRRAIVNYVRLLHHYGMYAELSLMWGAPAAYRATYQSGAPDADHSPALWSTLAATFKNDGNVVLAPWGETIVDANCFLRGGVCEATFGPRNTPYETAGTQQAVDAMRRAGYAGVISIPGNDYANNLSEWLSHEPSDPRHQLIAEAHVYGKNTCGTTRCFQATYAPVAKRVPLILGETGETHDNSGCGSSHISEIVNWADAHRVGYEAWTWDTWGNCGVLIDDYAGRPRGAYGTWIKSHYARSPARRLSAKR
jgi:hypothetical protein